VLPETGREEGGLVMRNMTNGQLPPRYRMQMQYLEERNGVASPGSVRQAAASSSYAIPRRNPLLPAIKSKSLLLLLLPHCKQASATARQQWKRKLFSCLLAHACIANPLRGETEMPGVLPPNWLRIVEKRSAYLPLCRRPVVYSLRWPSALFRLLELGGGEERERENMWGIINNEREKTQQLPLFCGMDHRRREKSSQEQGGSEGENG
jgi:hypothetical protein